MVNPAKGPRQLESARKTCAHALVRQEPIDAPVLEPDRAGVVAEGAAGAAHKRAFSRAVRTDEANAFA